MSATSAEAGVLVVGYGNPLRGDDGLGWHAAALLAGDPRLAGARVLARHQLTPELAEDVSRAALVVLVDARAGGGAPGAVTVRRSSRPRHPACAGPTGSTQVPCRSWPPHCTAARRRRSWSAPPSPPASWASRCRRRQSGRCQRWWTRSPESAPSGPMHEASLVAELVEACERHAGGRPVALVRVRHAATIAEDLLRQAFRLLAAAGPLAAAELELERVEPHLACPCGLAGAVGDDQGAGGVAVCPRCGAVAPRPRGAELEVLKIRSAP